MSFAEHIKRWYQVHKRDLPWRNTRDPYTVWISEVILQQTRVDQGLPYFYRFTEHFPTVKELAKASQESVLKLWQGLGYYSRARNMHATAKLVVHEYQGIFPRTYPELIKLQGIGPYTAAAIASFCNNEPEAVLDGNVYRLLSRFFGVDIPVNSTAGKKVFSKLAEELVDKINPGLYNQAIMEFGALQCKPGKPDCRSCPLAGACRAYSDSTVEMLPVKIRNKKTTERFFHYLVIKNPEGLYLNKRTGRDIWKNLYDFPLIETLSRKDTAELITSDEWASIFKNRTFKISRVSAEVKHVLSHQVIYARFYNVEISETLPGTPYFMVAEDAIGSYAVPKLIHGYFENNL